MEVRNFNANDIKEICKLINEELGYSVSEEDLNDKILQMREQKSYKIFIATENGIVIGFIGLQICLAFEIPGKITRIIALAVSKNFQRTGAGSKLIQEAEHYSKMNDVSAILVNSGLMRTTAHNFYKKQNFYKKGFSFCKRLKK